ncbi:lipid droplet-associated protein 1 [Cinnamomum micranthum f. kanehirae]|uniref:Lipid droplet-associated protein 1 n=1 Tax=Cinnamomum micranthum f. kanehirae TaxID=337451 RepID=A0A3S3PZN1_9MAGN|nr:lipid droplet-associated protein 1 [Cinnamomum micranthum f. kanehirae]
MALLLNPSSRIDFSRLDRYLSLSLFENSCLLFRVLVAKMAEADAELQNEMVQEDDEVATLKYLDFVQSAAVHAVAVFSSFYDFAKDNSGPLKPGVQTVEGTVKIVMGPVYEKIQDIPLELLKFADRKVDGLVQEVDRHVPVLVKQASSKAFSAAHKAPEVARSIKSELDRVGVVDTAAEMTKAAYAMLEPTAKDLYLRYEPVAEHYAVSAWRSLNRLPLFPEVAHILVPTVAYWTDKYNNGVRYMEVKGFCVASYMPLVPTERIAKVFGESEDEFRRPEMSPMTTSTSEVVIE